MDSYRNGRWVFPFKKFSRLWVKCTALMTYLDKNLFFCVQFSRANIKELFNSVKAPVGGMVSGSIVGMEGSTSLRRVGSMRRTFMSGTAGLKKRSMCLQVKFQVVCYFILQIRLFRMILNTMQFNLFFVIFQTVSLKFSEKSK